MNDQEYVLVDTDVYSFLTKRGDKRGHIYLPHVKGKTMCVCFITVGELLYGAKKKKWSAANIEDAKQKLRSVMVVPYDYEMCVQYGELKAGLESKGKPVDLHDLWIGACALRHGIPLISNNRKHFERMSEFGLVLISEAPVIAQIESQGNLTFETETTVSPSERARPSLQSTSSSEDSD